MERIVITGATGFLGRNLAKLFLDQGAEVFAPVRPQSGKRQLLPDHPNLHVILAPLEETGLWEKAIGQADGFFHFAWGGVNRGEIDSPQVQERNVKMSLECVRAASRLGCGIFMDAGSRVEYGTPGVPFKEDLDCHPVNAYGQAKWEFYQKAAPLCGMLGMGFFHLRFFSVYGPGDHPWSIISTLSRELPKGEKVALSACRHLWNFMYIQDAVQAVYELYRHGHENPSAIVNVAGADTRPLRAFVEEIHQIAGGRGTLEYGTFQQAKEGAPDISPDISRLLAYTKGSWREEYSFCQGIEATIQSFQAAPME